MRIALVLLAAVLGAAPAARAAPRAMFPTPKVDFAAEGVLKTGQLSIASKLYYSHGKERREHRVEGGDQVILVRHDLRRLFVLLPEPKMYVELSDESARGAVGDLPVGARVDSTRAGDEVVNGHNTRRYRVRITQEDGSKLDGNMWVTPDDIVVKLVASATRRPGGETGQTRLGGRGGQDFSMELTKLVRGSQAASLFELPSDYQPVPTAGGVDAPSGEPLPSLAEDGT